MSFSVKNTIDESSLLTAKDVVGSHQVVTGTFTLAANQAAAILPVLDDSTGAVMNLPPGAIPQIVTIFVENAITSTGVSAYIIGLTDDPVNAPTNSLLGPSDPTDFDSTGDIRVDTVANYRPYISQLYPYVVFQLTGATLSNVSSQTIGVAVTYLAL